MLAEVLALAPAEAQAGPLAEATPGQPRADGATRRTDAERIAIDATIRRLLGLSTRVEIAILLYNELSTQTKTLSTQS